MRFSHLLWLLALNLSSMNGLSQLDIPPSFDLVLDVEWPEHIAWLSLPDEVLFIPKDSTVVLSFNSRPTRLFFYNVEGEPTLFHYQLVHKKVLLSNSYYDEYEHSIFINRGMFLWDYMRFDTETLELSKVRCRDVPKGCSFYADVTIGRVSNYYGYHVRYHPKYILKFNSDRILVYIKRNSW
ncbi:hypothetical protein [Sanyastnella coralliicola]|uniref:hypothetical protein n=1 Tax=Sanyastnella coralliicola TaxID=3069118 RepID=UPI0027B94FEA|nr:hypothetical protein [Longitalea sp. SCSIO 12813]